MRLHYRKLIVISDMSGPSYDMTILSHLPCYWRSRVERFRIRYFRHNWLEHALLGRNLTLVGSRQSGKSEAIRQVELLATRPVAVCKVKDLMDPCDLCGEPHGDGREMDKLISRYYGVPLELKTHDDPPSDLENHHDAYLYGHALWNSLTNPVPTVLETKLVPPMFLEDKKIRPSKMKLIPPRHEQDFDDERPWKDRAKSR